MHPLALLWSYLWPNVFAPSVWTLAAVGWSHRRILGHMRRHRDEVKAHVTNAGRTTT